jgi:hypothetical protein
MDTSFDERKEFELDGEEYSNYDEEEDKLSEPQTSPYFLTPVSHQRSSNRNVCRYMLNGNSVQRFEDPCAVFNSATRANQICANKAKETGSAEEVSILLPANSVCGYNISASLPELSSFGNPNHTAVTIEFAGCGDTVARKSENETAV